jgi:hypothetical protein
MQCEHDDDYVSHDLNGGILVEARNFGWLDHRRHDDLDDGWMKMRMETTIKCDDGLFISAVCRIDKVFKLIRKVIFVPGLVARSRMTGFATSCELTRMIKS